MLLSLEQKNKLLLFMIKLIKCMFVRYYNKFLHNYINLLILLFKLIMILLNNYDYLLINKIKKICKMNYN